MEKLKGRASNRMDALFRTGYPHPINLFVVLMLTLLPLMAPFAGEEGAPARSWFNYGLSGLLSLIYLVIWSQLRVFQPERSPGFFRTYLAVQTVLVSAIYALDGGWTRFLFVVVAVQAVYISPVRRWAPYLGTLAALWLTLYLVISPGGSGASMVATIGMYFLYLVFAAMITFTTVQQERQNDVAQALLESVDARHHTLRAYDLTVESRSETEERERLARTIHATLIGHLSALIASLDRLLEGSVPVDRDQTRAARLKAKDVLAAVRKAVRTLRPGEDAALNDDDDEAAFGTSPQPDVSLRWTDPIRVYHVWNIGVIVLTTGVIIASALVGGAPRWMTLAALGLMLLGAYWGASASLHPWSRTLFLLVQAGLILTLVALSEEPLTNHLFLIIAAQVVFMVPTEMAWLIGAVTFPTLLSGAALWLTGLFQTQPFYLLALTASFGVTNFFGAVMAFMTRRHVEARERALIYAQQLAEVNRMLEGRLAEVRAMAIARERVRMAREIHDGLGHHLTIVILDLQQAEELVDEDPGKAKERVASARRIMEAALEASREMVEALERFDRPLPVAVQELIRAWQQGNQPRVVLELSGDFTALSTATRITIYRALQESLTNIQKHARASLVLVALRQMPDRVILTVSNDDAGGSAAPPALRGGFGLIGLHERAEALQGEFRAERRARGGYRVELILPLGP